MYCPEDFRKNYLPFFTILLKFFTNRSTASLNFDSLLVPVQTIFPLLNNKNVALVSGSLYTRPGNCSGSYSVVSNFKANELRFRSIWIEPEATIFWTLICGKVVILIFIFSIFLIIACTANLTLAIDFAPVKTILPELNIKAEVFGSFILITKPGNCSGLYSVFGRTSASFIKGMSCSSEVETTIFWIVISVLDFVAGINNPPLYLYTIFISTI